MKGRTVLTNAQITDLFERYINGVESRDADFLEPGAKFFDWETEGDVRNSLREMRDALLALNTPSAPPREKVDAHALQILNDNWGKPGFNQIQAVKALRDSYGKDTAGKNICGLLDAKLSVERAMVPFLRNRLEQAEIRMGMAALREELARAERIVASQSLRF